jgi:membrane protein implicated in regulation of membrane protease activity
MQINFYFRLISFIIISSLIVFGHVWISILVSLCLLFYINNYYESIFFGLLIDSIYGSNVLSDSFKYNTLLFSVIIFILVFYLKKVIIKYGNN